MVTEEERTFINWLTSNGSTIHPAVQFHQFPNQGRGCVATQDIEPDTLLFTIPRPLLLTTSTSHLPPLIPTSNWSLLTGWTPLILCLMFESLSGTTSPWSSYFSLLPPPHSFNSLMYWSEEELAELNGSLVLSKIGREEAEREFREVVRPFVEKFEGVLRGGKEEYTLERYHWAGSLILSRSFHVESGASEDDSEDDDDEEEEEEQESVNDVAMVPMADILNALSGKDNARLFYEPTSLNMMSTEFIPSGTQIYNTYADPPNSDLLRRYGHVDDSNPADLVEISLETVVDLVAELGDERWQSQEAREERAEWLLEVGVDDAFPIDQTYELPEDLISSIRAFLASEQELEKSLRKGTAPKPKLDRNVVEFALRLSKRREGEYGSSVEEDEELLTRGGMTERKRMAVVVRLGEKKILRETAESLKRDYLDDAAAEENKRTRADKSEIAEMGSKRQKR